MQVSRPQGSANQDCVFTASKLEEQLNNTLYPHALPQLQCTGCVYNETKENINTHRGYDIGAISSQELFGMIFDDEQHMVMLHEEKILFEGHFALAVAYSAFTTNRVDEVAAYAFHGGFTTRLAAAADEHEDVARIDSPSKDGVEEDELITQVIFFTASLQLIMSGSGSPSLSLYMRALCLTDTVSRYHSHFTTISLSLHLHQYVLTGCSTGAPS